jgi:hypothetical protein
LRVCSAPYDAILSPAHVGGLIAAVEALLLIVEVG